MNRPTALMNWSGGKDSALALYHCRHAGMYDVASLLTTVSEQYDRVSMHGVRAELLAAQADRFGLPLRRLALPTTTSMDEYNARMQETLTTVREQGVTHAIFGDIFLEDLRQYREQQLARVNLKAVFPLWQRNTTDLIHEFVDLGFKAVLVCVNEKQLGPDFLGRDLDRELLRDLPKTVDPCGENGEYHSFVYDGPIFSAPIRFTKGDVVRRTYAPSGQTGEASDTSAGGWAASRWDTGFWYQDLLITE